MYNFEYLFDYSNPSLYIVGTRDEFCSPMNLENLIRRLPFESKIHRLQGADHFFSEHVEEVENLIEQFLKGWIPSQAGS
jgi:alpha/beta superfamily hydrolase